MIFDKISLNLPEWVQPTPQKQVLRGPRDSEVQPKYKQAIRLVYTWRVTVPWGNGWEKSYQKMSITYVVENAF